jgi:hypothetical protein
MGYHDVLTLVVSSRAATIFGRSVEEASGGGSRVGKGQHFRDLFAHWYNCSGLCKQSHVVLFNQAS